MAESPAKRIRSFVAVDLPVAHREALAAYLSRLEAADPRMKWVSAANLHLTLRFLGPVEPRMLDRVMAGLASLGCAPFTVALGHLGLFGRPGRVRVVWLSVAEGASDLTRLAALVESACVESGLAPEPRPFRPHLTLARAPGAGVAAIALASLPQPPELGPWQVGGVTLYRSTLRPSGAVYEALAGASLDGGL
ncbi:MAG: RNA 2',3'-cyclic phosphodiesterase [Candidatus Dormibacterales bacterium]